MTKMNDRLEGVRVREFSVIHGGERLRSKDFANASEQAHGVALASQNFPARRV